MCLVGGGLMWAMRPTTAPPLTGELELDVGPDSNMRYKERRHIREGLYVCSSTITHHIWVKIWGLAETQRGYGREGKMDRNNKNKKVFHFSEVWEMSSTRGESRNGAEVEHKSRVILWSKGCWAVLPTLKHHLEAVLWMSSVSSAPALNRGCQPADCWMDDRSRFRSSWVEEVHSTMRPNRFHGCCSLILTWDQFIDSNYCNYQSDCRQRK